MQKKLIAAAVAGLLAAPVFAQSTVTISGLVKAGYDDYKLNQGNNSERQISDQSSRIIFAGTEDLGGGLKAFFQMDNRFSTDVSGTTLAGGNSGVGLMGGFGKVTLGRWDIHYNEFGAIESNRAGALETFAAPGIMSQVNGVTVANGTRTPNLVKYDSPNVGGFTGTLAWSANAAGDEGSGVGDGSKDGAWNLAARYAAGPLVAGLSYYDSKFEGPNNGPTTAGVGDQKGSRVYAGYTFPMGLKVGLGWDRSENRATNGAAMSKRTAWFLPASYSFGPSAVYLTYARAGNVSGTSDTGATQWTLGYDYALSKRTNVGAYYTKLTNKTNATYDLFGLHGTNTAADQDARQVYLGIAHSF